MLTFLELIIDNRNFQIIYIYYIGNVNQIFAWVKNLNY